MWGYSNMRKYLVLFLSIFLLQSCARDLSSNVYTSDSTLSLTMQGKIVSVRPVVIKNSDNLSSNTTGALSGGALGAVAGSGAGHGSGQAAAVVGGAIVGGVVGALAEGQLGKSDGYEYIIKVNTSDLKDDIYGGTAAVRRVISSAKTNGLITVVQGKDVVLSKGQKVYVIFSDKRTRVIPSS